MSVEAPVDYKALIQDRKTKQSRPIVRHPICLVPELYADLEEAQDDLRYWTVKAIDEDDDEERQFPTDRRAGSLSSTKGQVVDARARVEAAEAKIAKASVVGVFKAPPSQKQAELGDELRREQEDKPDQANQVAMAHAARTVLAAFDRFEVDSKRIDLGLDDLKTVLEEWSEGELLSLATKVQNASKGAPDIPFSVQQSLRKQVSAAT